MLVNDAVSIPDDITSNSKRAGEQYVRKYVEGSGSELIYPSFYLDIVNL